MFSSKFIASSILAGFAVRTTGSVLPTQHAVQTPRAGTRSGYPQPEKAVEHGQLAAIGERPKTARRMRAEVADRHLTREHKRHRPRKQPGNYEKAANRFNQPGSAQHRGYGNTVPSDTAQEPKKLLNSVKR